MIERCSDFQNAQPLGKGQGARFGSINFYGNPQHYIAARDHLSRSPKAKELLLKLENSPICELSRNPVTTEIYTNNDSKIECTFDTEKLRAEGVIRVDWDPHVALMTSDGKGISPAVALFHELTHTEHLIDEPAQTIVSSMMLARLSDKRMDNQEEHRTTLAEGAVAKDLNEGVRNSHTSAKYRVKSPETTETKNVRALQRLAKISERMHVGDNRNIINNQRFINENFAIPSLQALTTDQVVKALFRSGSKSARDYRKKIGAPEEFTRMMRIRRETALRLAQLGVKLGVPLGSARGLETDSVI